MQRNYNITIYAAKSYKASYGRNIVELLLGVTLSPVTYVTGFAKTQHNVARTEIHFIAWHESHTLALSRHTDDRTKDNQVCFHRQHFLTL